MRRATTTIALAALFALTICPSVVRAQDDQENPLDQPAPTEQPPVKPADEPAPPPEPQPPPAPVEPPMLVLGLGAGVYIPTSALAANFLVGIDAAYQLPWLGGRFGVGAGLSYSQPTTSGTMEDDRVLPTGSFDYDSVMRELVLDILFTFRVFDWGSSWSPHAGIGPVFYFLSHEVSALGHDHTETSTQAGFLFTAGVDYRIWRGALIGEVRIPFALVGQRTTGDSNVGAISVVVGYRFRI